MRKGGKPPKERILVFFCVFLMRVPLTQQVLYSSQVAPRAAQVRVHFHGLVEEGLLAIWLLSKEVSK